MNIEFIIFLCAFLGVVVLFIVCVLFCIHKHRCLDNHNITHNTGEEHEKL